MNKATELLLTAYHNRWKTCTFCGGDGWVTVDVGQMLECVPCGSTGKQEVPRDKTNI